MVHIPDEQSAETSQLPTVCTAPRNPVCRIARLEPAAVCKILLHPEEKNVGHEWHIGRSKDEEDTNRKNNLRL